MRRMRKRLRINVRTLFPKSQKLNRKCAMKLHKLIYKLGEPVDVIFPRDLKLTSQFIEAMTSVGNVAKYESYDDSVVLSIFYPNEDEPLIS